MEYESNIPTDHSSFMGLQPGRNIGLYNTGDRDSPTLLRDGNGTIYPLSRNSLNSIRDPQWLDLPPMKCLGMGTHSLQGCVGPGQKTKALVLVLVTKNHLLMPKLLACDIEGTRQVLTCLESAFKVAQSATAQSIVNERCDGGRNVIHACVSMCSPTSNKDADVVPDDKGSTPTSVATTLPISSDPLHSGLESLPVYYSLRDMVQRAASRPTDSAVSVCASGVASGTNNNSIPVASDQSNESLELPSLNLPSKPLSLKTSASQHGGNSSDHAGPSGGASTRTTAVSDPVERRANSLAALKAITESPALASHLQTLLSARDAQGYTPFMQAVSVRAYAAALTLLDVSSKVARQCSADGTDTAAQKKVMQSFIFPLGQSGCNPDDSPLHVLCSNDTCSFTWTGAHHISQDIFDCLTCGLTDSLCCCTECARTCHKGHDFKLKHTSPTAYCDCWKKCKCKSLAAG